MKKYFLISLALSLLSANFAIAAIHTAGTNVVGPDGTVYFIKETAVSNPCIGCPVTIFRYKYPYPSAGVFLSYGFNSWKKVVPASAEDLALPTGSLLPPATGSLIRQQGISTVYLITNNGEKMGFTSYQVFQDLGYSPNNIFTADISYLQSPDPLLYPQTLTNSSAAAHPRGTLVNQDSTIYLISYGNVAGAIKYGIPNMRVFNSYGFSLDKVVPANSYDRQLNQVTVLSERNQIEVPLNLP